MLDVDVGNCVSSRCNGHDECEVGWDVWSVWILHVHSERYVVLYSMHEIFVCTGERGEDWCAVCQNEVLNVSGMSTCV